MSVYKIYICQYAANCDAVSTPKSLKPRHLEIVVRTGTDNVGGILKPVGSAFHIQGGAGNGWGYTPQHGVHYDNRGYCGRHHIGNIPASQAALTALENLLGTIPFKKGDPNWNCQNWVWEAALLMRREGYQMTLPSSFRDLDAIMDNAWEKWNDVQEED